MIRTFSQSIKANQLIFELSKESAQIYNQAIELHQQGTEFKNIGKIIDQNFENKFLIAQSRQASYQQYVKDFKAYLQALSAYKNNPTIFSGKPNPPHKQKFLKTIYFKSDAIRFKNDTLILSTKNLTNQLL